MTLFLYYRFLILYNQWVQVNYNIFGSMSYLKYDFSLLSLSFTSLWVFRAIFHEICISKLGPWFLSHYRWSKYKLGDDTLFVNMDDASFALKKARHIGIGSQMPTSLALHALESLILFLLSRAYEPSLLGILLRWFRTFILMEK